MSGTSLDGVDLALCRFSVQNGKWTYAIEAADCKPYPAAWRQRLLDLEQTDGVQLQQAHVDYGKYLGELVSAFLVDHKTTADLVASHGHTLYHLPHEGLTFQLGSGLTLAKICGLPVASDFRTGDVALGGQGAPLVPIGDRLLFPEYTHCINLGGFANVSFEKEGTRIAYDIGPCNLVLNHLANQMGHAFDHNGDLARKGQVISPLFDAMNALPYFAEPAPKSLGKEWVVEQVFPLLAQFKTSVPDQLCTVAEHAAHQISRAITTQKHTSVLVTGGGARNQFLMERTSALSGVDIQPANDQIIDYKEALIFALLGALRLRCEINILSSVTGSSRDHCSGALSLP